MMPCGRNSEVSELLLEENNLVIAELSGEQIPYESKSNLSEGHISITVVK